MRPWPEALKQSLRYLAAARYYLPLSLKQGDFPDTEQLYEEYLHQAEFGEASELLECLGELNSEDPDQFLFWSELLLAAEHMGMADHASRYRERLRRLQSERSAGA